MFDKPDYGLAISAIVALVVIDVVYISKQRFIPAKYLLPGTLFLLVFAVYPIFYLIYISTTNYGTGNNLNKETAIERIEANSISAGAESIRYDLQILAEGQPRRRLGLPAHRSGRQPLHRHRRRAAPRSTSPRSSRTVAERRSTATSPSTPARPTIGCREVNALIVPGPSGDIVNDGFGAAFAKTQNAYVRPRDRHVFDSSTNTTYSVVNGQFVNDER